MPFTANRQFKANPRLLARAKDMHYTTHDGRQVIDGTAGLWCCQCRPLPRADRRGDPEAGRRARFRAHLPVRPSQGRSNSPRASPIWRRAISNHVFFAGSGSEAAIRR
jgi:hypothetical protein